MNCKLLRVWLEGIKIAYPTFLDQIHPAALKQMQWRHIYPSFESHITEDTEVDTGNQFSSFSYNWNPTLDYFSLRVYDKNKERRHYILSIKRIRTAMKQGQATSQKK